MRKCRGSICTLETEDPVKGPELNAVSCVRPHQEAYGSLMEGRRVDTGRLQKPGDDVQGEVKAGAPLTEQKQSVLPHFPCTPSKLP
ncbi:hypothetical protein H920_00063 [Fukomys damarensis]|uniref:Uncharacterized protein n=1 Tax=Fukomys damarensis TaxID=885580 RepID=A0A091E580_FUKDA|nr:hypothetical protein H920_14767 [Fukomys damarensis]KFO38532.1 hypothetical protein H920_00063 [Fukomys damarensis]